MSNAIKNLTLVVLVLLIISFLPYMVVFCLGVVACLLVQVVGKYSISKIEAKFFYEDDENNS